MWFTNFSITQRCKKYTAATGSIHSPNSPLFGVPSTQKSFYPLVQLETPHPDKMRRSLIFVDVILNIWFFLSTEVQTEYVAEFSSITCMRLFLASDLSGKWTSGPFRCCMASVAVPPKLKFWQTQRRLPGLLTFSYRKRQISVTAQALNSWWFTVFTAWPCRIDSGTIKPMWGADLGFFWWVWLAWAARVWLLFWEGALCLIAILHKEGSNSSVRVEAV